MKNSFFFVMFLWSLLLFSGCATTGNETVSPPSQQGNVKTAGMRDIIVPPRPNDTICADFNGDGLNDMVTVSKVPQATVLLNKKNGEFEQLTFETMPHNRSVAVADVNGDDYLDFALLTEAKFGPVFLNDGKGHFTAFDPNISTPTPLSFFMSSADLNSDGLSDFVIVSESSLDIMVVYNRGNLVFESKTYTVPDDILKKNMPFPEGEHPKEDNKKQIKTIPKKKGPVQGGTPSQITGTGEKKEDTKTQIKAVSEKKAPIQGGLPSQITGKEDAKTLPQKLASKKIRGITGIRHMVLADVNGDGLTDMVFPISGKNNKVLIAENKGHEDFTFKLIDIPGVEGTLSSVALIRNSSNTIPRIAAAQSSPQGKVFILKNDGAGNLTLDSSFETGENMLLRMASHDIDRDGNDDLLLTFGAPLPVDNKSPVQVWIQEQDGKFRLRDRLHSNGYAAFINVCQFSEGKKTIVLSNIHEGTLTLIPLE